MSYRHKGREGGNALWKSLCFILRTSSKHRFLNNTQAGRWLQDSPHWWLLSWHSLQCIIHIYLKVTSTSKTWTLTMQSAVCHLRPLSRDQRTGEVNWSYCLIDHAFPATEASVHGSGVTSNRSGHYGPSLSKIQSLFAEAMIRHKDLINNVKEKYIQSQQVFCLFACLLFLGLSSKVSGTPLGE